MNKDQVKGALEQAAGKAQGTLGRVTGDTPQRMKGLAKELVGMAQRTFGDAKAALKRAHKTPSVRR